MTPTELISSNMSPLNFLAGLADVHNNFHIFDKVATPQIILFEIFLIVFSFCSIIYLKKHQEKIMIRWFLGFLIFTLFQMFTASMFSTIKLGPWAYLYIKTSWIIGMIWGVFIVWADYISNKIFKKHTIKNFVFSILFLSIIAFVFELLMISLGIRVFSEDTLKMFSNTGITLFPIYYSIIISLFIISFYKYWSLELDQKIQVPVKKNNMFSFLVCFLGILNFDIVTRTMVNNSGWPEWSYIINNVSIILTFLGAVLIWLSVTLIDEFFGYFDNLKKFVIYFGLSIIPIFLLEVFLISKGMRVYCEETVNNFSGIIIPGINVPIEVFLGSTFYLLIVLPFVIYVVFLMSQRNKNNKKQKI